MNIPDNWIPFLDCFSVKQIGFAVAKDGTAYISTAVGYLKFNSIEEAIAYDQTRDEHKALVAFCKDDVWCGNRWLEAFNARFKSRPTTVKLTPRDATTLLKSLGLV